ncbi:MAG: hypothetical protein LBT05_15245 [Planctomycetaceae bacterium]|jgi:hypothetical protein|nr:hypothetical protein [Planctomycetaceae bacterium]
MNKKLMIVIIAFVIWTCFIAHSCGKRKSSVSGNPPVQLKQIKEAGQNWQKPYNKGVELHNSGKLTEASYYFSNALGALPGNFEVIKAYYETMIRLLLE